jgi:hypothetical protein
MTARRRETGVYLWIRGRPNAAKWLVLRPPRITSVRDRRRRGVVAMEFAKGPAAVKGSDFSACAKGRKRLGAPRSPRHPRIFAGRYALEGRTGVDLWIREMAGAARSLLVLADYVGARQAACDCLHPKRVKRLSDSAFSAPSADCGGPIRVMGATVWTCGFAMPGAAKLARRPPVLRGLPWRPTGWRASSWNSRKGLERLSDSAPSASSARARQARVQLPTT